MVSRRYTQFAVITVLVVLLVVSLAAQAAAPPRVSIAISDKGITYGPKSPVGDKMYEVLVKNFASGPRGLKISGKDRAGTEFVRYTGMIEPGQTQTLSIYVPRKTSLRAREMLTCEQTPGGNINATFGRHVITIRFR